MYEPHCVWALSDLIPKVYLLHTKMGHNPLIQQHTPNKITVDYSTRNIIPVKLMKNREVRNDFRMSHEFDNATNVPI